MSNHKLLVGWRARWNRSLLLFLRRRVRAPVDIEDLAQETYLRLLRARDLSDVRNPQAYLLRVASHVVGEWQQNLTPTASISEDEDALIDDTLPEFELDATLSRARLDQTFAAMSASMRAVVLLKLRDEYRVKEIAEKLGMSVRQVRRHLARGYARLREAMEA